MELKMAFPKNGIIAEDIADIGGVALSTVYGHIHWPGFPEPLGEFYAALYGAVARLSFFIKRE
jgi:hypothetical protein